jgi:hypothetical protein
MSHDIERGARTCVNTQTLPWRPSTFAEGVYVKDFVLVDRA